MRNFDRSWTRLAWGTALALAAVACSPRTNASRSGARPAALAAAVASSSTSAGTLLCDPTPAQVSACAGSAEGGPCTLTDATGSVAGTCSKSLDGTKLGCVPVPESDPEELVSACAGKAAGDPCEAGEAFGDDHEGVCVADGTTLVCGRASAPAPESIAACDGKKAGDACASPDPSEIQSGTVSSETGVCSLGPAGSGALACAPAQALLPNGANECAGLAAGASCTLGRSDEAVSGTCVKPAEGGDAVCVVACGTLGEPFEEDDAEIEPSEASSSTSK